MMEGGKVIKMEVDYSETVAKKIPEAKVSFERKLCLPTHDVKL